MCAKDSPFPLFFLSSNIKASCFGTLMLEKFAKVGNKDNELKMDGHQEKERMEGERKEEVNKERI